MADECENVLNIMCQQESLENIAESYRSKQLNGDFMLFHLKTRFPFDPGIQDFVVTCAPG